MTICATDFAFANEEECFIIEEDTCGTLKKPTTNDRAYTVGPVDFGQEWEFLDDEQIRAYASRFSPRKGRHTPGDYSFNTYVKPSGTYGTPPEHHVLFKCLMGEEDTSGATVIYKLASQLDSFSLWTKKGHTVFAMRGATAQGADFSVVGDAIAGVGWSGNYMEQLWAGTVRATGNYAAPNTDLDVGVSGAERYSVGMYVTVGGDTNGGVGYLISKVNPVAGLITIAALTDNPIAAGVNPDVEPWWPSAAAEYGEPVHGKMGLVTIGGENAIVLGATVTIANNIKYYVDEKNNLWTAERYGRPKVREIEGNLNLYFLEEGPSYFYRAGHQVANALVIPAGNVSAYIMELQIPYAEYRSPKISGDEEFIQDVPFIAVASGGDDEMTIEFK